MKDHNQRFITVAMGTAALIYYRRRGKRGTSRVKSAGMRDILVVRYLPHFKSAIQVPIYVIGIDL